MAEMPEIGTLSNKTVSKLAGLAPLARDSGKHQGRRTVRGGRAPVREILFIVASVVGRYEPDFIAFRERLANAGKPPKVVRIALAHKLLVRKLNACSDKSASAWPHHHAGTQPFLSQTLKICPQSQPGLWERRKTAPPFFALFHNPFLTTPDSR